MNLGVVSRRQFRIGCLLLVLLGAGLVGADYVGARLDSGGDSGALDRVDSSAVEPIPTASEYRPENYTVITSVNGAISSAREKGTLVVVDSAGREVYVNNSYNVYDDVDPSPEGRWTVNYVAAEKLSGQACAEFESDPCTRNFIERLNFSTGEVERLYAAKTPRVTNSRWHDADRLDEHRFLLADIAEERILVVNVTTDRIVKEWNLSDGFDRQQIGASDEHDWAHLNDVEMLSNGYVMASPRNFDQVIFVRLDEGVNRSLTLGSDDNYDVLFEQHNPDYLTAEGEPPAVLVADSENNRIVEYSRQDGEWRQTWVWADQELKWPRDADRLPNGNTLVTDTSGHRVVEVSPSGEVLWGVKVPGGYDAERLGTGDESATGKPATALETAGSSADYGIVAKFPPTLRLAVNGVLFVLPPWAGLQTLLGGLFVVVAGVVWTGAEAIGVFRRVSLG
ncbi:hypothetical protein [Halorussus lipolyticus]|uniref:hypothetical protein n=1 Tax=Halorussus lipolyticus TaxID=3034024 RepID=UPI0023E84DEC|nr:hypothetical protein [Halorussus sp. DT80]